MKKDRGEDHSGTMEHKCTYIEILLNIIIENIITDEKVAKPDERLHMFTSLASFYSFIVSISASVNFNGTRMF